MGSEEAAIVEAYAFAERVRDEPFGDGAVAPEAAAGPEPAPAPPPAPAPAPAPPAENPRSKEERLRAEAVSEEHLRTHFPKNPFCKICSVAKITSARVAKKPDTKADDKIDAPTKAFEQPATDDVIIAKGDDHVVGLTPETSLPNRWPHNATLERDIREEKEPSTSRVDYPTTCIPTPSRLRAFPSVLIGKPR